MNSFFSKQPAAAAGGAGGSGAAAATAGGGGGTGGAGAGAGNASSPAPSRVAASPGQAGPASGPGVGSPAGVSSPAQVGRESGGSDDLEPTVLAVCASIRAAGRDVGVACLAPRARDTKADKRRWRLELYQFEDSEQFSNFESVVVREQPAKCYVHAGISAAERSKLNDVLDAAGVEVTELRAAQFKADSLVQDLGRLAGESVMAHLGELPSKKLAMSAAACVIGKSELLGDSENTGAVDVRAGDLVQFMRLDTAAVRALNLLPDPRERDAQQLGSLHAVLARHCWTRGGARLLKRWMLQPLVNLDEITQRQDLVEVFVNDTILVGDLRDMVRLPDVGAVAARLQRRSANLVDIVRVSQFAELLPRLTERLAAYDGIHADRIKSVFVDGIGAHAEHFEGLLKLCHEAIDMDAVGRGQFRISPAWSATLKEISSKREELERLVEQEHERVISSSWGKGLDIKCEEDPKRYGWVFRAARKHDKKVRGAPGVTIATVLKDGVRFRTSKLREYGESVLELDEQYEEEQRTLVAQAVETARTYVGVVEAAAALVCELDAIASMGQASALAPTPYVRPTLTAPGEGDLIVHDARHPVMEAIGTNFIANDYKLRRAHGRLQVITGPNMGGKSTYIRSLGAIVVLAQMGCFVPASDATISIVDAVMARVGASDSQLRGVSTFMAEMLEASTILQTASDRSLVIIDELGRGTSTYDGFGLAWAIAEQLATETKCFCLFATHFHELTSLDRIEGVTNRHVYAQATGDDIVMLYQVKDGPCPASFGIHVAKLAAFPDAVIAEAKAKAAELERFSSHGRRLLDSEDTKAEDADASPSAAKRARIEGSPTAVAAAAATPEDEAVYSDFLRQFAALPLKGMEPAERAARVKELVASFDAEPARAAALRKLASSS